MKAAILFLVIFISAICPVSSRALSDENNLLIEHLDKALDRGVCRRARAEHKQVAAFFEKGHD